MFYKLDFSTATDKLEQAENNSYERLLHKNNQ